MITITNEKEKLKVTLKYGIDNWQHTFTIPSSDELDAILKRRQLQEHLNNTIEKIRRDAYELGWKDKASKKTAKKTWFNGNINSDYVG